MIKVRSIQRVMVKVDNLDGAVDFCEKVLGAEFFLKTEYDPNSPAGSRCAMSERPGLELIEITSDTGDLSMFVPEANGKEMFNYIRDRAPGVFGIVLDMDGVEEARAAAEEMGITAPFKFDFTQAQMDMLGWGYCKYLEYFLDPGKTGGTLILLSDFAKK